MTNRSLPPTIETPEAKTETFSYDLTYDLGRQTVSGTLQAHEGYKLIKKGEADEGEYQPVGRFALVGNDNYTIDFDINS